MIAFLDLIDSMLELDCIYQFPCLESCDKVSVKTYCAYQFEVSHLLFELHLIFSVFRVRLFGLFQLSMRIPISSN